jgi:hypothetical protein
MPATTTQGLPYPLPTEPVAEGAAAIRSLAEAVDPRLPRLVTPAQMTSLVPTDGMAIRLLVDAAAGIIWHLVYRAASPNPEKWEYVGGSPLWGASGAEVIPAVNTWWSLATPNIVVPRAGLYEVTAQLWQIISGATVMSGVWGVMVNGAAPPALTGPGFSVDQVSIAGGSFIFTTQAQLAVNASLVIAVNIYGAGVRFWGRSVAVRPIRIA